MKTAILAQFPADSEFVKGFDGSRVSLTTDPAEALAFDSMLDAMLLLPVLSQPYSRSRRAQKSISPSRVSGTGATRKPSWIRPAVLPTGSSTISAGRLPRAWPKWGSPLM
jgi:hypothetical protein